MFAIEIFKEKVKKFRKKWEVAKNTQDIQKKNKLVNECKKISEELRKFAYGDYKLVERLKISVNDFVEYFKIKKIEFRTSDKINDPVFYLYTKQRGYSLGKNLGASFNIYGLFDDVINFVITNYKIEYEGYRYLYNESQFERSWNCLYEDYPDLEEYLWNHIEESLEKDIREETKKRLFDLLNLIKKEENRLYMLTHNNKIDGDWFSIREKMTIEEIEELKNFDTLKKIKEEVKRLKVSIPKNRQESVSLKIQVDSFPAEKSDYNIEKDTNYEQATYYEY